MIFNVFFWFIFLNDTKPAQKTLKTLVVETQKKTINKTRVNSTEASYNNNIQPVIVLQ